MTDSAFRSGNTAASLKQAGEDVNGGHQCFPQWKHCGLIEAQHAQQRRAHCDDAFRSGNTAASLKRTYVQHNNFMGSLSAVETLRPH